MLVIDRTMKDKRYSIRSYKGISIVVFENRVLDSFMSFKSREDAFRVARHANGLCPLICKLCTAGILPNLDATIKHFYPSVPAVRAY